MFPTLYNGMGSWVGSADTQTPPASIGWGAFFDMGLLPHSHQPLPLAQVTVPWRGWSFFEEFRACAKSTREQSAGILHEYRAHPRLQITEEGLGASVPLGLSCLMTTPLRNLGLW